MWAYGENGNLLGAKRDVQLVEPSRTPLAWDGWSYSSSGLHGDRFNCSAADGHVESFTQLSDGTTRAWKWIDTNLKTTSVNRF
jgi:prepilin-type processing-associated H-X9-DG protein